MPYNIVNAFRQVHFIIMLAEASKNSIIGRCIKRKTFYTTKNKIMPMLSSDFTYNVIYLTVCQNLKVVNV